MSDMDDLIAFLGEQLAARAAQAPDIHTAECGYDTLEFLSECRCGEPGRVLADVESKRRIIAEHQPRTVLIADYETYMPGVVICSTCSYPHGDSVGSDEYMPHPCKTLRLLALPYAGHPDYREEWKP